MFCVICAIGIFTIAKSQNGHIKYQREIAKTIHIDIPAGNYMTDDHGVVFVWCLYGYCIVSVIYTHNMITG